MNAQRISWAAATAALRGVAISLCIMSPLGHAAAQSVTDIRLRPADATFDTPDEEFTQVTSVRQLADGRLIVADRWENRLAVIDWSTHQAAPIGRSGDGPGEYRGIGWLYELNGDSTLVTDALSRRWFVMAGAEIVETIPAHRPLNIVLGPLLSGIDRSGRILGSTASHYPTSIRLGRDFADSVLLLLSSPASFHIDTLARVAGRGRHGTTNSPTVGLTANPLATEDQALLFRDGWIALAWAEPYRVDWRSPSGEWVRGAPLPFTREPVRTAEKCAALRRWRPQDPATPCHAEAIETWPEYMPPFQSPSSVFLNAYASSGVWAMPDGNLLVRRAPSLLRAGTKYDIVNRGGNLVATLSLASNEAVIGFGSGSIYVVVTDDVGLQRLQRHPWP